MTVFSIVTINWNDCEGLQATYQSVARQTYRALRWIVIDGASTDGSVAMLHERFPAVNVIQNENNDGFARANNLAMTGEQAIALAHECPAAQWCTVEVRALAPCFDESHA